MMRGKTIVAFAAIGSLCLATAGSAQTWEKEWKETLAKAKQEGKVVVATSPDPIMREISARFKERFGIAVEHLAGRSSQLASRLRSERQAGVYTVDVFMGGIQTVATILYREKMLDPLKPALVLPEVTDAKKWKKGKVWFVDPEEKYVARPFSTVSGLLHFNTDFVKPSELATAKDLLNPKWRGKISSEDPTTPGSGSNTAARIYAQMGEEFMRKLYIEQRPMITRERRQLTDWLARGTYPISFGAHDTDVDKMKKEGFPLQEIFGFPDMPPALTGSPWQLVLMAGAPHPNAAKVFVNWMLSKEGLQIYARGEEAATLRTDVDESFLPPERIPRPGINYFDTFDWEWTVSGKEKVRLRLKEILGR
ncbi:MAG TPA: extracellular solute-binding protein [Candidatus Acidoferrales bacterium]|nr:extracellular solute-binding protein [Candidatus Acidoferrales bacterium]